MRTQCGSDDARQTMRAPLASFQTAGTAPRACFVLAAPLSGAAAGPGFGLSAHRRPRAPARPDAAPRRRGSVLHVPVTARGPVRPSGEPGFQGSQKVVDTVIRAGRFFQSTNGQILLWAGFVWLVLSGNANIILDSFLFIFLFVTVVPIIGLFAFRLWAGSQLVQGTCPNCANPVSGMRNKPFQCLNCGEVVKGEKNGDFSWGGEPSSATIDVDVVDVIDVDVSKK